MRAEGVAPEAFATAETPQVSANTLGRELRSRHVAMITVGGVIGAGLFVGSSTTIATVGPAVVLSYLLAGALVTLVMQMLGEMASLHPGAGSFTEYARLGLGPWAGFVGGWLYWYFWVVLIAIEAIAGASIIGEWVAAPQWQIAAALLAVMTAINLMSTRSFGEFEFWFSSIKVAAIIGFIVVAAGYAFGVAPGTVGSNLSAGGGFAPFGAAAVLAGVASVIFSLVGAEITTIAAAEAAEPSRVVARLTTTIITRILLFYVLSIFLITAVVPWTSIVPGQSPFVAALERVGVPGAAFAMKVVVLTAVLSCLNSGLYVVSRVLFVLARHGDAPAGLVTVNRRKVPSRSIGVAAVASALVLGIAILSPDDAFSLLVNASGATMLMIYLLVAVSQIRLRRRREREGLPPAPVRMWLFPWASYAAVAGTVVLLAAMGVMPDLRSQLVASVAVGVLVLLAYLGVRRRSASAPATGPALADRAAV